MSLPNITIFPNPERLAVELAITIQNTLLQAFQSEASPSLSLAGGSSFLATYQFLFQEDAVPWSKIQLFFGDERCVPPNHVWSNFGQIRPSLDQLKKNKPVVHRIEGEAPPHQAAKLYNDLLKTKFPSQDTFSLCLLGVGSDGHTASIFPKSLSSLLPSQELAVAVPAELEPAVWRVTTTPGCIRGSQKIFVVATGSAKAPKVQELFQSQSNVPLKAICPLEKTFFFFDEAAASQLSLLA